MFPLLALSLSLVVVNLVFALIALTVGFAAGAWFFGGSQQAGPADRATDADPTQTQLDRLDVERTALASDRLRDLAAGVASDVVRHSADIQRIEDGLSRAKSSAGEIAADDVRHALQEITQANADLQKKLEKAEHQIQVQSEAIRVHESEARTDSLTGLANRRAFDIELQRRLSEWRRHASPVSLLIVDVDHFKRFNDTHGHQAGDEVLRHVGKSLLECSREIDLACRYGGEEFAIILPTTLAEDGAVVAERVRKAVEAMQISFEGKTLSVTLSLGLAQAEAEEEGPSLLRRADEALYQSKDAGRNNAHLHNGDRCVPITPGLIKSAPPAPDAVTEAQPASLLDTLPNRTRFLEILRQECRRAADLGEPIALLAVELDGYHRLVKEFGGAVARLTLDAVAQFLDNACRDADLLGRVDEGRFVVLMPGSHGAQAEEIGARVQSTLAACSVPMGDDKLQLETRVSAAEMGEGDREDTEVTLMRRVELRLHAVGV